MLDLFKKSGVFQSTRPRGARRPRPCWHTASSGFQSTRPRGARHRQYADNAAELKFQSTRPRGARLKMISDRMRNAVSIHAPTRGATRIGERSSMIWCCFNPRAHAGRDSRERGASKIHLVSIHAPTRGATDGQHTITVERDVSIHAPTRGATGNGVGSVSFAGMFQSTRPRGARPQVQM